MPSRFEKGDVVTVQVRQQMPFGLLVRVVDGPAGIIRERDIAWEQQARRAWREHFGPGDTLQAVVLREGSDGCLELSLRLASNDPWLDVPQRYAPGQLVNGVVTGIQPYGFFVEIEPGVTGLLHRSRLPAWTNDTSIDVFWPGDHVRVCIQGIDAGRRRMDLSLERAWAQRWKTAGDQGDAQPAHRPRRTPLPEIAVRLPLEQFLLRDQVWSILVVEDDRDQCQALGNWLRKAGHHVLLAYQGEEALELLQEARPDLVLMDVGLPGLDGIETLRRIRAALPQVRRVVMTDWARASERMADLEVLRAEGAALLIKPLLPEDLVTLLLEWSEDQLAGAPAGAPAEPIAVVAGGATSATAIQADLAQVLDRLRRLTRAGKVVLFEFDPVQRKTSIAAASGPAPLAEEALVDLVYSPVRDAAEDQLSIRIEDVQRVEARIRYLKPLIPFRSCLGVPVPGELPSKHALFLFYPRPGTLAEPDEGHAEAAAMALGALLERAQLQERTTGIQRLALLGQLTRALVHEINHQLSPIAFALGDLEEQCARIERLACQPSGELEAEVQSARDTLVHLGRGIHTLIGMARLFGQVTIQGKEQVLRLDTVVGEVVRLLRDMADRSKVVLDVRPAPSLLFTRAQAVQVQQILLNVIMNAVQQVSALRPQRGGRVVISLGQKRSGSQTILQINVEDDGPGVHRRLWDRIFELGFTTRREEGSGLGLYIVRSLVEGMGGRAYVDNSYVLWGTTFVIELPFKL